MVSLECTKSSILIKWEGRQDHFEEWGNLLEVYITAIIREKTRSIYSAYNKTDARNQAGNCQRIFIQLVPNCQRDLPMKLSKNFSSWLEWFVGSVTLQDPEKLDYLIIQFYGNQFGKEVVWWLFSLCFFSVVSRAYVHHLGATDFQNHHSVGT